MKNDNLYVYVMYIRTKKYIYFKYLENYNYHKRLRNIVKLNMFK